MKAHPSRSGSAQVEGGSVVALWRYPVKSMMGEELNAANVGVDADVIAGGVVHRGDHVALR